MAMQVIKARTTHDTPLRGQTSTRQTLLRVGFWSAVLTAIFYLGWIGGFGLSYVLPAPWNQVSPMATSVLIPLAWVPLIVTIRAWAPLERKIFGDIAVAFAVMYGALLTMNYFVVLTVTIPTSAAGGDVGILALGPKSYFLALESVGYTLMSLSALFASFVITGGGIYRWTRWTLFVTGCFAVLIPLQMFFDTWPSLVVYLASPRELALTAAVALLAVMFRREDRAMPR